VSIKDKTIVVTGGSRGLGIGLVEKALVGRVPRWPSWRATGRGPAAGSSGAGTANG